MKKPVRECADNVPLSDSPLNYAPKTMAQTRQELDDRQARVKLDAVPLQGGSVTREPPWKRKMPRDAFVGDVANVVLRDKLALAPDRLPEPPSPAAPVSMSFMAGCVAGTIVVVGAAVAGYLWGSAIPLHQTALVSDQASLAASDRSLSTANSKASDLNDDRPAAPASAIGLGAGAILDQARDATNVMGPAETAQRAVSPSTETPTSATPLETSPAPAESVPRRLDADEVAFLMKRGVELMALGDMPAARMMFQRAADGGEAAAAIALAETYDPVVLKKKDNRGAMMSADAAQAQSWYEKAKKLGSIEAPDRLEKLARRSE